MKLVCVFLIMTPLFVFGQNLEIELPEYSKYNGIHLIDGGGINLEGLDFELYKLDDMAILKAEQILSVDLNKLLITYQGKDNFREVNNVQRHFRKWRRQYVGLRNDQGDIFIVLNLINFCNKRKAKKYASDFKKDYISGFGGFYEKNTTSFIVNLNEQSLDFFQ